MKLVPVSQFISTLSTFLGVFKRPSVETSEFIRIEKELLVLKRELVHFEEEVFKLKRELTEVQLILLNTNGQEQE